MLEKATDGVRGLNRQSREGDGEGQVEADLHPWWYQLAHALERNNIPMIEPLHKLRSISLRSDMLGELERAASRCRVPVAVPQWSAVESDEWGCLLPSILSLGLEEPFIVKPELACGPEWAHTMVLVLRKAQLRERDVSGLGWRVVVQRFISHKGELFKAYKLGKSAFVASKPSVPDYESACERWPGVASLRFHSLKELETPQSSTTSWRISAAPSLLALSESVGVTTGLELFGVDVVAERGSGELFAVDLNYFPSCKSIPEAGEALSSFLLHRLSGVGPGCNGSS